MLMDIMETAANKLECVLQYHQPLAWILGTRYQACFQYEESYIYAYSWRGIRKKLTKRGIFCPKKKPEHTWAGVYPYMYYAYRPFVFELTELPSLDDD